MVNICNSCMINNCPPKRKVLMPNALFFVFQLPNHPTMFFFLVIPLNSWSSYGYFYEPEHPCPCLKKEQLDSCKFAFLPIVRQEDQYYDHICQLNMELQPGDS